MGETTTLQPLEPGPRRWSREFVDCGPRRETPHWLRQTFIAQNNMAVATSTATTIDNLRHASQAVFHYITSPSPKST